MLPLAVQLDNYRKRFGWQLTSSKIAEPWVRVRYWHEEVRAAYAELEAVGRDPSPERDDANDALDRAMGRWRAELKRIEDRTDLAIAAHRAPMQNEEAA